MASFLDQLRARFAAPGADLGALAHEITTSDRTLQSFLSVMPDKGFAQLLAAIIEDLPESPLACSQR